LEKSVERSVEEAAFTVHFKHKRERAQRPVGSFLTEKAE